MSEQSMRAQFISVHHLVKIPEGSDVEEESHTQLVYQSQSSEIKPGNNQDFPLSQVDWP